MTDALSEGKSTFHPAPLSGQVSVSKDMREKQLRHDSAMLISISVGILIGSAFINILSNLFPALQSRGFSMISAVLSLPGIFVGIFGCYLSTRD